MLTFGPAESSLFNSFVKKVIYMVDDSLGRMGRGLFKAQTSHPF
jgi:hypothetical protein